MHCWSRNFFYKSFKNILNLLDKINETTLFSQSKDTKALKYKAVTFITDLKPLRDRDLENQPCNKHSVLSVLPHLVWKYCDCTQVVSAILSKTNSLAHPPICLERWPGDNLSHMFQDGSVTVIMTTRQKGL